MFDKLLLMAEGYPVYYGKARESMEYFSSLRFIPQIPMNPAEFLLDLATGQVGDISLPEDVSESQGSLDTDKTIIKVGSVFKCHNTLKAFISQHVLFLFDFFSTCNSSTKLNWRFKKEERTMLLRHQNIYN